MDLTKANLSSLDDAQILSFILSLCDLDSDSGDLARVLLKRFGNLGAVLNADQRRLMKITGVNLKVAHTFKFVKEIMIRILRYKTNDHDILSSHDAVYAYLKLSLAFKALEEFRILLLNAKNILIGEEVIAIGTVNQTVVYPREIIKHALFYEAVAIVLVHNHPSGSAILSNADIELTKRVIEACNAINVAVHDHIIVTYNKHFSFRSFKLI